MIIKKSKAFWITIATITVILLIAIILQVVFRSGYYAFYLSTGDIYFGKLAWFSRYTIKDPYYLQFTQSEQSPIRIVRFQNAFWGPGKELKLNPQNVIWVSKLSPTSQVVKYIESQGELGPMPIGPVPGRAMPSTPTTTSPGGTQK